jgi:hypothetical protein
MTVESLFKVFYFAVEIPGVIPTEMIVIKPKTYVTSTGVRYKTIKSRNISFNVGCII